eukprot:PhF_6_TR4326/c0_g1_i1/m.5831
MFRRVLQAQPMMARTWQAPTRTFFGKGWDNAAIEVVYRSIVRRENIRSELQTLLASTADARALEKLRTKGEAAAKKGLKMNCFLPAHLGDPHRVLKAYSLTAYPILDGSGHQVCMHIEGHEIPTFADPDDDYSKVVLPQLELTKLLAEELLRTLSWEVSPRGAASLLESLYRGAEIPDTVFETPKILDSIENLTKEAVLV